VSVKSPARQAGTAVSDAPENDSEDAARAGEARDPGHWLYRLSSDEWLAAAETELRHAADALARRAHRPGITHARRAAGMAWNAVLARAFDERFGRSYMDHVVALAGDDVVALAQWPDDDASIPSAVRDAARLLRDTPAAPAPLITIGKPDRSALEAAKTIVDFARAQLAPRI